LTPNCRRFRQCSARFVVSSRMCGQRVLAYVFDRLGLPQAITAPATPRTPPAPPAPTTSIPAATNSEPATPRDIRTFKDQKKPKTAMEMAALVAYYLAELAPASYRKATIEADDITTYFKQADFPLPTAPRQTLFSRRFPGPEPATLRIAAPLLCPVCRRGQRVLVHCYHPSRGPP
jgi:hypothetical protein